MLVGVVDVCDGFTPSSEILKCESLVLFTHIVYSFQYTMKELCTDSSNIHPETDYLTIQVGRSVLLCSLEENVAFQFTPKQNASLNALYFMFIYVSELQAFVFFKVFRKPDS